jgi:hypothetical protein
MEATGGFEPPMGVLQTPALPLGDVAVLKTKYWCRGRDLNSHELTLTTPSRWRVYHSTTSACLDYGLLLLSGGKRFHHRLRIRLRPKIIASPTTMSRMGQKYPQTEPEMIPSLFSKRIIPKSRTAAPNIIFHILAGVGGIEPPTSGFGDRCSTN